MLSEDSDFEAAGAGNLVFEAAATGFWPISTQENLVTTGESIDVSLHAELIGWRIEDVDVGHGIENDIALDFELPGDTCKIGLALF